MSFKEKIQVYIEQNILAVPAKWKLANIKPCWHNYYLPIAEFEFIHFLFLLDLALSSFDRPENYMVVKR
jgi:hypothetical protein